jgi:hypothetical protein
MLGLIASEYINGEDERIDGFRSKHTIRITATRQKSEVIISEIEQVVQNIRREDIYLGDLMQPGHNWQQLRKWADAQFNSTTIKHLSRMTNTEIDELPKKRVCTPEHSVLYEIKLTACSFLFPASTRNPGLRREIGLT